MATFYKKGEEDEKNNQLTSATEKSRVCPNCNFANNSDADVCARCKLVF